LPLFPDTIKAMDFAVNELYVGATPTLGAI
jgi:hypothetical protein